MGLIEIPRMTFEDLEKVLKYLPEPNYAEVALFGYFDYSSISKQAGFEVKGLSISNKGGLIFRVDDPTKRLLLDIYKNSIDARKGQIERYIELVKADWWQNDRKFIGLTPYDVSVQYPRGMEPSYISAMMMELASSPSRVKVKISLL